MKKLEIIYVGWYSPNYPGGAEKSIVEELKNYVKKGYNVKIISFDETMQEGEYFYDNLTGYNFPMKSKFFFSRYLQISFNRNYILNKLSTLKLSPRVLILTQSIIAPTIAEFCVKNKINYVYYLRDENNLNIFNNYEIGFRRILKSIKFVFEFPWLLSYKNKNTFAIKNASELISNSNFIYNLLLKKYKFKSKIIYPKMDYSKFDVKKIKKKEQFFITFIGGGNAMKGFDIVEKIAKKMQTESFLIVGNYPLEFKIGNVTYTPNLKDIFQIYKKTKLLLVPSRCSEAFGRVVLEANYLNIPVISSDRGGLPEVNTDKDNLINDLEDIDLWIQKISFNLSLIKNDKKK